MKIFPIFMMQDNENFLVYIPNLDGYTQGNSLEDGLCMAKEYIILLVKEGKRPKPSSDAAASRLAKKAAKKKNLDFTKEKLYHIMVSIKKDKKDRSM